MTLSLNIPLKVYEPDPTVHNGWVETADSLPAPRFCLLYSYCLGLLVNRDDPAILSSFDDIVGDDWARVKAHATPLVGLVGESRTPQGGRNMAVSHRGVGPNHTMVFFDYQLVRNLELATDPDAEDRFAFVCIVTVLHEFRHWVRGVIKGMQDGSTKGELHLDWGRHDGVPGESGYVGEHRLWGGVLVAGFGLDGAKELIRFSTRAQSAYTWRNLKAVGITKGPQHRLKWLFVYKWSYVQQVVQRMRQNLAFMPPDAESLASLDKAAYSPSNLDLRMGMGADVSATALGLPTAQPPPHRPFTFHATDAKYYPVLLVDSPEDASPNVNARHIPGRIQLPVRDRVKRFLAHVFRRDKRKIVFIPMTCNDSDA